MSRKRKFDPERMKENDKIQKKDLLVDVKQGGEDLPELLNDKGQNVGKMISMITGKKPKKSNFWSELREHQRSVRDKSQDAIISIKKEQLGMPLDTHQTNTFSNDPHEIAFSDASQKNQDPLLNKPLRQSNSLT